MRGDDDGQPLLGAKFPKEAEKNLLKRLPGAQLTGDFGGKFHFEKEKGKDVLGGMFHFESKDLQGGNAEPFSLTGDAKFLFNLDNHSAEFEQVSINISNFHQRRLLIH